MVPVPNFGAMHPVGGAGRIQVMRSTRRPSGSTEPAGSEVQMSELSFMEFKGMLGLLLLGGGLLFAIWLRIDAVRALRESKAAVETDEDKGGSESRRA